MASERPTKRARLSDVVEAAITNKEEKDVEKSLSLDVPLSIPDEDQDDDELEEHTGPKQPIAQVSDLYLDTINRQALDFDFEKLCSVSLSNIHVYACLVCGKYFQGRGKKSWAYSHSVHEGHHPFINLESRKVYVLPDGYQVHSPSLDDIAYLLNPTFTPSDITRFSTHALTPSFDLSHTSYIPGYIGLNNIKHNDHLNVIIHTLVHVPPLRNFLLLSQNLEEEKTPELVKRFASLARKIWNRKLFKAQVSPHEFLQEVNRASKGKFRFENRGDPGEFLNWLLNRLHIELGGTKKSDSSIIYKSFQGQLTIDTQKVLVKTDLETGLGIPASNGPIKPQFDLSRETITSTSPFLHLAIDLPPPPIFQDAVEKNIIPQVTLSSVLAKYDGRSTIEQLGSLRRYKCTRLPPYLILTYKRFTKNNFVEEKNPTIVNFPLKGVDFSPYLLPSFNSNGETGEEAVYDLLANVTHESTAGTTRDRENTVWRVALRAGGASSSSSSLAAAAAAAAAAEDGGETGEGEEGGEKWFQIQDLIVETVQKEMIFLGEVVLQVWERRGAGAGAGGEVTSTSSGVKAKAKATARVKQNGNGAGKMDVDK